MILSPTKRLNFISFTTALHSRQSCGSPQGTVKYRSCVRHPPACFCHKHTHHTEIVIRVISFSDRISSMNDKRDHQNSQQGRSHPRETNTTGTTSWGHRKIGSGGPRNTLKRILIRGGTFGPRTVPQAESRHSEVVLEQKEGNNSLIQGSPVLGNCFNFSLFGQPLLSRPLPAHLGRLRKKTTLSDCSSRRNSVRNGHSVGVGVRDGNKELAGRRGGDGVAAEISPRSLGGGQNLNVNHRSR